MLCSFCQAFLSFHRAPPCFLLMVFSVVCPLFQEEYERLMAGLVQGGMMLEERRALEKSSQGCVFYCMGYEWDGGCCQMVECS